MFHTSIFQMWFDYREQRNPIFDDVALWPRTLSSIDYKLYFRLYLPLMSYLAGLMRQLFLDLLNLFRCCMRVFFANQSLHLLLLPLFLLKQSLSNIIVMRLNTWLWYENDFKRFWDDNLQTFLIDFKIYCFIRKTTMKVFKGKMFKLFKMKLSC